MAKKRKYKARVKKAKSSPVKRKTKVKRKTRRSWPKADEAMLGAMKTTYDDAVRRGDRDVPHVVGLGEQIKRIEGDENG